MSLAGLSQGNRKILGTFVIMLVKKLKFVHKRYDMHLVFREVFYLHLKFTYCRLVVKILRDIVSGVLLNFLETDIELYKHAVFQSSLSNIIMKLLY